MFPKSKLPLSKLHLRRHMGSVAVNFSALLLKIIHLTHKFSPKQYFSPKPVYAQKVYLMLPPPKTPKHLNFLKSILRNKLFSENKLSH